MVHPGGVKTNIIRNARFYKSFHGGSREENIDNFDEKFARTSPSKAAARIIAGIKNDQPRIIIGRDAWLMDRIIRTFPVGAQSFLRRMAGR